MKKFTLIAACAALLTNAVTGQDRVSGPVQQGINGARGSVKTNIVKNVNANKNGYSSVNATFVDAFDLDNSVAGLTARGYLVYREGTGPVGTTEEWIQGNPAVFLSYSGPDTGFLAANYNTVASGDIDNWLVTPEIANVAVGDIFSFWSNTVAGSIYPDSIAVMYNAAGDSIPSDPTWVELDAFLVDVGGAWLQNSYTITTPSTAARFALRYRVTDGGPLGANSNYIGIDQLEISTPAAVDGGVTAINGLVSGCGLSATTSIEVTINNNGASAITGFPVSYTINAGTPVVETYTASIAAGASANYTFTATADFSAPNTYNIVAATAISGDGNAANDASNTSVDNIAPVDLTAGPLTMGFEPAEDLSNWVIEDVNADGGPWALAYNPNFTVAAHTGDYCLRVSGAADVNDWIFTTCVALNAGTNYSVNYWTHLFAAASPGDVQVAVGTTASAAAMTQQIVATSNPLELTWVETTQTFSVAASGTYYIGFHGTAAVSSILRIDDLNLSIVTGVNNLNKDLGLIISPNPSKGVIQINNISNEKDFSLEIYNTVGQIVLQENLSNLTTKTLDLTSIAKGVYSVKLKGLKGEMTQKLVLN
jgi:Secretion system C-terminal sorting domain